MAQGHTIEDIAREVGVSKSTVSRVIAGKGRQSEETRKRILELVDRYGFRPNALAQGLASSRTFNIGVIIPDDERTREFSFFRECLFGVCDAAGRAGCDVLMLIDSDPEQLRRVLENRKVDGIIATRGEAESGIPAAVAARGVPFVTVGGGEDGVYVDNDNRGAARALVAAILEGGERELALLGGDPGHLVNRDRLLGFEDACREGDVSAERRFLGLSDRAGAEQAADEALSAGARCLVCMDDDVCAAVMARLLERGTAVPGKVRVACMYDSRLMARLTPPVTAVRFDARALGSAACGELLKLIAGKSAESRVLGGFTVEKRESTALPNAPAGRKFAIGIDKRDPQ